jgi:hypothetical protein
MTGSGDDMIGAGTAAMAAGFMRGLVQFNPTPTGPRTAAAGHHPLKRSP